MIVAIGQVPESTRYKRGLFEHFQKWVMELRMYQLDIETTMTKWWCDKEIITIQFGDMEGKRQCVLHWTSLSAQEKQWVKDFLQRQDYIKVIHNAQFEYVVLRFHDIILENVWCTMVTEQILNGGLDMPKGYYALGGYQANPTPQNPNPFYQPGVCMRYTGETLDKSQQTTFSHEPLTEEQVVYAADDVRVLGSIYTQQMVQLREVVHTASLELTAILEMEVLLSYGDMMYNGMELNQQEWLANIDLAEPIIQEAERNLYEQLLTDPILQTQAIKLGYLAVEDEFLVNWNSPSQKLKLLQILDPTITGSAKAMLQKLIKQGHIQSEWLQFFVDGAWIELERRYTTQFREELIEADLLRPAGHVYLNWNSTDQVLALLKAVDKKLKSLDKESMNKFIHPIGKHLKDYKDTLKLKTTYGEEFINKYVEPDGKVRTRINQVLTTGRVSSSNPNMQNIPAKESVGNRYRNCFTCDPNERYVDGDYTGQELCVIAYLSKDPVWNEAIQKGQDLHSVCAEMTWGKKWVDAAEPDCTYYFAHTDKKGVHHPANSRLKCECKKHKPLRYDTKSIDFGLAYGMTEYKLAADTKSTVPEARKLIERYFSEFPKIGKLLDYLGKFGVENGFIQTIWPFFRKRFFPEWSGISKVAIQMHVAGVEHNYDLAKIERASKNMPIQGCSGDMSKLSLCMIRWFLNANNLNHKIRQVMQVHDQDTTIADEDIAEWWKLELKRIMEEAALFIIPTGLIKADVNVTLRWSK